MEGSNESSRIGRRNVLKSIPMLSLGGVIATQSIAAKGQSPNSKLLTVGIGSADESNDLRDVWVDGDYAYAGGGYSTNGLVVWDVSDPSNPTFEAIIEEDLQFGRGVVVRNGIAYVAGRDSGSFVSVDVSNPTDPVKLDSVTDSRLEGARGVEITSNGKYAFVAMGLLNGFGGEAMAVIDISDPSDLIFNQLIQGEGVYAGGDVHQNGNHVFMSGYQNGDLMVFDISEPDNVVHVTTWGVALKDARGLSSRGKTLFINSPANNAVVAADISNPANVSEISRVSDPILAGARGNSLKGSNLFVSGRSSNQNVWLDVSNARNMEIIDFVEGSSLRGAYGSFTESKYVYTAAAGAGDLTISKIEHSS